MSGERGAAEFAKVVGANSTGRSGLNITSMSGAYNTLSSCAGEGSEADVPAGWNRGVVNDAVYGPVKVAWQDRCAIWVDPSIGSRAAQQVAKNLNARLSGRHDSLELMLEDW